MKNYDFMEEVTWKFLLVICVLTLSITSTIYAADIPDIEDIMSAFESTISKVQAVTQRCAFKAEIKITVEGALASHAHRRETKNFIFYRDLNRFDVRREVLNFDKEDNVDNKESNQFRLIVDEKQKLISNARLGEPPVYIVSTQASNTERGKAYRSLAEIRALDGYLPGDETNSWQRF